MHHHLVARSTCKGQGCAWGMLRRVADREGRPTMWQRFWLCCALLFLAHSPCIVSASPSKTPTSAAAPGPLDYTRCSCMPFWICLHVLSGYGCNLKPGFLASSSVSQAHVQRSRPSFPPVLDIKQDHSGNQGVQGECHRTLQCLTSAPGNIRQDFAP